MKISKAFSLLRSMTILCSGILAYPQEGAASLSKSVKPGRLKVAIQVNPSESIQEQTSWLAYLLARSAYITQHMGQYPNAIGPISANFEEEVEARTTAALIYSDLQAKDKSYNIQYFNDLLKIQNSSFMREYVWTTFKKAEWRTPSTPLRSSEFEAWKSQNLPNHKPITEGNVIFELEK